MLWKTLHSTRIVDVQFKNPGGCRCSKFKVQRQSKGPGPTSRSFSGLQSFQIQDDLSNDVSKSNDSSNGDVSSDLTRQATFHLHKKTTNFRWIPKLFKSGLIQARHLSSISKAMDSKPFQIRSPTPI